MIGSDGEAALQTAWLLGCVLFSSIGLGLFVYGRRQRAVVPLTCGLLLMLYPYFVPTTLPLVLIGVALTAFPWFVRV